MNDVYNIDEAKELLSYHSGRNSNIDNPKWRQGFLGSLRPFRGTLQEDNFIEVMECMKVLQKQFSAPQIDSTMVADVVAIVHYTRAWSSKEGMLGRNHLLSKQQEELLMIWCDLIEECLCYLLDGAVEEAFFEYEEYKNGDFFEYEAKSVRK